VRHYASNIPFVENPTMRLLTLTWSATLVTALVAGCAADPTAENTPGLAANAVSTPDHFSSTYPYQEIVVSPCNGETIELAGIEHDQWTVVGGQDSLHYEIHFEANETGVGQTTGARYILRYVLHEGSNLPKESAINATFGQQETYRFISSLPGLSFSGVLAIHAVRLPSGEVKFTRENFVDFKCQ
jgi:hypothetical protein